MIARLALIPAALWLMAGPVLAQPGSEASPIVVKMRRGTDTIRLTGVLRQDRDCCAYLVKANAGQTLRWRVTGPAVRVTITSPKGDSDGPEPAAIPLPYTGAYVFTVHPNTMADNAFGPFKLTLTIPPLRK